MKPETHIQVGLDHLRQMEEGGDGELALLCITHLLAGIAIRDHLAAPAADETTIIPTINEPQMEPWIVATANGDHTCWVNDRGDMQWLAVGQFAQPSWRQLFVERKPRT